MILLESALPDNLSQIVRTMIRVKTALVVFSLPILPITFFGVVFFRYILERDLFAYEEWLLPICFWIFFLGSALGTYYDKQINADLLDTFTDNQNLQWLRKIIIQIIELTITLILVYWAWLMLADEISDFPGWKTTIALKIPFIIPRIGIFIGFAFMAFYSGLAVYLLLRVGPDGYAEAMQKVRHNGSNEAEV
ncbi:MAG TPA: C4-dicarboxylate ABC transporter permease [Rhodobacteraceae bacterium]|jgi:TRAP-type transport system small permease protein|nr:TRAP transporter small permease subunit [Paracoccaceae bacterium]HAD27647.1 C4-dicarboxylate ABC transporter permease [Paracoccaceae bacterium]|tara:strand:+ start:1515 stop:2093 length:579 start_codon:yes stop_codon:yes gene_type:complete